MSDGTNIYSWSDSSRKSAIGIFRSHVVLGLVTVFAYIFAYKTFRLGLLGESESIVAELAQGMMLTAVLMAILLTMAPIVVGRAMQKRTSKDYLNGLEIQDRFFGTPLTFAVSLSVASFLLYGGLTGSILFLAGKQTYGFWDLTIFLAAIPIAVAITYPIGVFVFRGINKQVDILKAQL